MVVFHKITCIVRHNAYPKRSVFNILGQDFPNILKNRVLFPVLCPFAHISYIYVF
jgi:hypothetical protein